ncbi:MAG: hypothetical protein M3P34_09865, partial [Actinomycetota bacterium]|nr:hypothetical protein [Actinomycetota bacterium]
MRRSRWILRVVVALGAAVSVTTVPWSPARAAVTSINPSSAQVTPGQGASATVSVRGAGVHCLEVRVTPEHPTVRAGLHPTMCDDEPNWTTGLSVSTTSQTPPGTYVVEVRDRESAAAFRLDVAAPPPPATTTTA